MRRATTKRCRGKLSAGINFVDRAGVYLPVILRQGLTDEAVEPRIDRGKAFEGFSVSGAVHHDEGCPLTREISEGGIVSQIVVEAKLEGEFTGCEYQVMRTGVLFQVRRGREVSVAVRVAPDAIADPTQLQDNQQSGHS